MHLYLVLRLVGLMELVAAVVVVVVASHWGSYLALVGVGVPRPGNYLAFEVVVVVVVPHPGNYLALEEEVVVVAVLQ